ncbi:unnamed protein product, partial [Candidula unifasciata]
SIKWLESTPDAEVDDLKEKKKELEEVVRPIMTKLYESSGGAPPPTEDESDSEKDEL